MFKHVTRQVKHLLKWVGISILVYLLILVVGLIPINTNFNEPSDGVEIFFLSNDVHTSIILPKKSATVEWSKVFADTVFIGNVSNKDYVAFGWGDRGFFLDVDSWSNFKFSAAAKALFVPTTSVMHAWFINPDNYSGIKSVNITEQQLKQLVNFIKASFKTDLNNQIIQIPDSAYGTTDAFFEANGQYHLFNTCNSWVGRALYKTGITVPWLTPMPKSPLLYIQ